VLQAIHRGDYDNRIVEVVAAARLVEGDWRTERRMRHSNQVARTSSTLVPTGPALPPPRDGAEVKVFNAFRAARSNMPPHDTLVISMNARLQLPNGSNVEVDDLIVRKGRVAVVEIDGDTHRRGNRYAADASRDQLLRDAGIHVERVVAEDMNKPEEVQALVRKVLARLSDG
jgi:very-short-patch-repair endonuclease